MQTVKCRFRGHESCGAQVGVVRAGQAFPVWVRGAQLFLRVTSAAPAPLVRLVRGAELAVAPRPRNRIASSSKQQRSYDGARAEDWALKAAATTEVPRIWLRALVSTAHRPALNVLPCQVHGAACTCLVLQAVTSLLCHSYCSTIGGLQWRDESATVCIMRVTAALCLSGLGGVRCRKYHAAGRLWPWEPC